MPKYSRTQSYHPIKVDMNEMSSAFTGIGGDLHCGLFRGMSYAQAMYLVTKACEFVAGESEKSAL